MGNATLVRPDGSTIQASGDDADHLRALGYTDESTEQEREATVGKSTEDFYSTPGQKALTAGEGLLSGATLGLSDVAFDHMGFDTAERGQYNPGLRAGTELLGGLAGLVPLGELTPAGLLAGGAKGAGEALAEGKLARGLIAGGIEGGGFGLQQALSQSTLNGDPLTAESVIAGVGWGAIYGGGLGGIIGGATARVEAKIAAREALEEAQAAAVRNTNEAWGAFRGSVSDLTGQLKQTAKMVDETVASAGKGMSLARNEFLNESLAKAEAMQNNPRAGGGPTLSDSIREAHQGASKAFGAYQKAVKAGDFAAAAEAVEAFKGHTGTISQLTGMAAPEISGFASQAGKASASALEGLKDGAAVTKALDALAAGPEEFAKMTAPKAEKVFAAIDKADALKAAEYAGAKDALKDGVKRMADAVGITTEGSAGTQLRAVWENMRAQATKKAAEDVVKHTSGVLPWMKDAAGRAVSYRAGIAAGKAAEGAGMGEIGRTVAYEAAKNIARGVLGVKAAVVGSITGAAEKWAPRVLKTAAVAAPRVEPLAVKLDGAMDTHNKNRTALMAARSAEIREAAGSVKDTVYKSISPLADYHPELAAAIHGTAVQQFQFLMSKLPKDPGLAFNRLQSLWKADPAQAEKFARYYEVFQNPVGVVKQTMATGHITPEAAEGLREFNPALYSELRVTMLDRISDPAVRNKLSYSDQVSLGILLNIPIHSTLTPQFVASQQQMYTQKNQKLSISPQAGQAGGGGRPAGPSDVSGATQAQKIEAH